MESYKPLMDDLRDWIHRDKLELVKRVAELEVCGRWIIDADFKPENAMQKVALEGMAEILKKGENTDGETGTPDEVQAQT